MTERKYIITIFGSPIIFDPSIAHSEININAFSAGFVKIWLDTDTQKLKAYCYGHSSSLGLKSNNPNDTNIIERFLNNE